MAAALASTGKRILVLEKGDHLRPSDHDRNAKSIFADGYFRPDETWLDGQGKPFNPGNYYCVGGNSKFFGAVFLRYRKEDFAPLKHMGGTTPGWPIDYETLEPFYGQAEALYQVRGELGADASEPAHSTPYPHPPLAHEPGIQEFHDRMSAIGMTPVSLPLGVDIDLWLNRAQTPWDAFPDTSGGKMDAERAALAQALNHQNVTLHTGHEVARLETDGARITGVTLADGQSLAAPLVILAAGAVQSAAMLLRSAYDGMATGLANRSDQVGRNFMNHNCSAVLALHPFRKNQAVYQKTLMLNDYYLTGGPNGEPLGNIQLLGKISGTILQASSPLPRPIATWIADRSVDLYAMSEDLPNSESRVTLVGDQISLDWKRSNWDAHEALVKRLKSQLRKAGYPVVMSRPFDRRTPSHQCGTARMGNDPATSVVNSFCQSHDIKNLFITDASVLPTSAAVNPALTIAALALRAADHIKTTRLAA